MEVIDLIWFLHLGLICRDLIWVGLANPTLRMNPPVKFHLSYPDHHGQVIKQPKSYALSITIPNCLTKVIKFRAD